jgi:radical SAM superfamily enzyme YgiQ (UPF0313 family)
MPLLGLQYVAASLLAGGFEVRVIDAAACCFRRDNAWIVAQAREFEPHVIAMGLRTRWALHAYELASALRQPGVLLVAGGPHATARPTEPLRHGFDVSLIGEAEESLVSLVDAHSRRLPLELVPGAVALHGNGSVAAGPPAEPITDLDNVPLPLLASGLFAPEWYGVPTGEVHPGGIVTSRGCPHRCAFCAAPVTSGRLRCRTPASVVDELNLHHRRCGTGFFAFWDDALTADRRHVLDLCAHLRLDLEFPLRWSCAARADTVDRPMLRAMSEAGCVSIDFGAESGDDGILRAVEKGLKSEQIVLALELAKEAGLITTCNFVLGFPEDTPATLRRTLGFMRRISPLVDSFSTLGVLVPFPGTPIYENCHTQYGFTDWWLQADHGLWAEMPPPEDSERFAPAYVDDANLEFDFFKYSVEVKSLIRDCLRFKGEHNLRKMGLVS